MLDGFKLDQYEKLNGYKNRHLLLMIFYCKAKMKNMVIRVKKIGLVGDANVCYMIKIKLHK